MLLYSVPWYDRDVGGNGETVGILYALSCRYPFGEFYIIIFGVLNRESEVCGSCWIYSCDMILLMLAICVLSLLHSAAIITWSSSRCCLTRLMISDVEVAVAAARAAFRYDCQSAVSFSN